MSSVPNTPGGRVTRLHPEGSVAPTTQGGQQPATPAVENPATTSTSTNAILQALAGLNQRFEEQNQEMARLRIQVQSLQSASHDGGSNEPPSPTRTAIPPPGFRRELPAHLEGQSLANANALGVRTGGIDRHSQSPAPGSGFTLPKLPMANLEKFKGDRGKLPAFISRARMMLEMAGNNMLPEAQVLWIASHLIEDAGAWWDGYFSTPSVERPGWTREPEAFFAELKRIYGDPDRHRYAVNQLRSIKQVHCHYY
ncbi:hypothetical protein TREMEDRAFT_62852 [Tremella mesenterica DSM 1558]|uniref:uncharacterized protein n=1 Tax=Tremella mesenterica (strain ATCC 24925 / CBS 8224 / DSM 1558 / NBRC 9311 / NRRL Y-6157 / RJB 2259-6 / UBC 559-6) TaxID=578456 RepID=UPI0003F49C59|nr:uncharacterized protein TREMEDRAFT_62852 [Tremella mesenterica DSM 1558]EIW69126.1 hypothetical protein TREMEDRAFT_62852 [Tremella mesenterica DSM 1558]